MQARHFCRRSRLSAAPRGITLMESLVAVTVTTMAGAAMLTSVGSAVQSSTYTMQVTVAQGLAQQLMDEIAGVRFPSATTTPPLNRTTRAGFDDVDDYDGWSATPPVDRHGHPLGREGDWNDGTYSVRPASLWANQPLLSRYTRTVRVERVVPDNGSGWTLTTQPTPYRRVTVRVLHTDALSDTRTLAEASRILAHVSPTP